MDTLGIALIVCGLPLVCASILFLMFASRVPSSSREPFEERLERTEHHLDETRRIRGEAFEEESAPTEPVLWPFEPNRT
jgi:hypothetical protein